MATASEKKYSNHPLFQKALAQFQQGNWSSGLESLQQLEGEFPGVKEISNLQTEMTIRSRMDAYEREENAILLRRRATRIALRVAGLSILLVALFYMFTFYSSQINEYVQIAEARFEQDFEETQLSIRFRNGQDMLSSGRPSMAMEIFREVQAIDPDLEGLDEYIRLAEEKIVLEEMYGTAIELEEAGDLAQALGVYREIQAQDPLFKDTTRKVEELTGNISMGELYDRAEKAAADGQWNLAETYYEEIRKTNPGYMPDLIENRLYDTYMNLAMNALNESPDALESLEIAETNYSKALQLRPQDANVLAERSRTRALFRESLAETYLINAEAALVGQEDSLTALAIAEDYFRKAKELMPGNTEIQQKQERARRFLTAQAFFQEGMWEQVITELEVVVSEDPGYANGTAMQILYEAYLRLGKDAAAGRDYDTALTSLREAAKIATRTDSPIVREFNAQIEIAKVTGAMGNYQDASFLYQDAINSLDPDRTAFRETPELYTELEQAERYMELRYYRYAYQAYEPLAPEMLNAYATLEITVGEGDYLAQLAREYGTTAEAIMEANDLTNPKQIYPGRNLIIPGGNK